MRELLAAVLEKPEDDGVRLVYADWLDENGEPERAELIRVQIASDNAKAAGLSPADYPNVERWLAREKDLILHRWQGWYPGCPVRVLIPPVPILPPSFAHPKPLGIATRGFVGSVISSAADWLQFGDAILAAHPVTSVRLTSLPDVEVSFGPFQTVGDAVPYVIANLRGINKPKQVPYTDRAAAEALCRHVWPAVRTWHLPPEPVTLEARRLTTLTAIPNELLQDNAEWSDEAAEWTREQHDHAVRILNGDPAAPVPLGVIEVEADGPAANPAPDRRRNSRMPAWLTEQRSRPRRPR